VELRHFAELLSRELAGIVDLSWEQVAFLHAHFELLLRWNQRLNLTSVRSPEEIITRHYCESIFFGLHLPAAPDGISVLDLGSGAGFPGVPMAVLRPEWQVTLVESHKRKGVFLRESTRGLHNVSVLSERVESVEDRYGWLVSRAVRLPDVLSQVPRLSGRVGLLMGEADLGELHESCDIEWSEPVRVPWGDRRICVYGGVSRGT
jgi:16S rRNA (guanine527-N7)-methyltransferase